MNGADRLALPGTVRACLFDLDGVLTRTASVHAAAWKEMFDAFLRTWADRTGVPSPPFDLVADYGEYVDGKPRLDGVRSFLQSRGIELPTGGAGDPPGALTVEGLGRIKNETVRRRIAADGVELYASSVDFVRAVRAAGLRTAVVSSSENTRDVLVVTRIADLFDACVDGGYVTQHRLAGKPAPDAFLAAAALLGVPAIAAAVFEDALAGVAAGRAGGFGFVVGVERGGPEHAGELRAHGADIVVADLSELGVADLAELVDGGGRRGVPRKA